MQQCACIGGYIDYIPVVEGCRGELSRHQVYFDIFFRVATPISDLCELASHLIASNQRERKITSSPTTMKFFALNCLATGAALFALCAFGIGEHVEALS
jgi:hypothetical protein